MVSNGKFMPAHNTTENQILINKNKKNTHKKCVFIYVFIYVLVFEV